MNIPAVVLSEAHQTPMDEEEPTRPDSEASKLWKEAAQQLAQKLIECSRVKQRCFDALDTAGAQEAYKYAKELKQLVVVLDNLSDFPPEMAATMRRQSVDRIVAIYEDAGRLFVTC